MALLHQPITGAELVMLEQVAGISVELEQDWITSNVTISVRIGKKCLNINGVNKIFYSLSLVFSGIFTLNRIPGGRGRAAISRI